MLFYCTTNLKLYDNQKYGFVCHFMKDTVDYVLCTNWSIMHNIKHLLIRSVEVKFGHILDCYSVLFVLKCNNYPTSLQQWPIKFILWLHIELFDYIIYHWICKNGSSTLIKFANFSNSKLHTHNSYCLAAKKANVV